MENKINKNSFSVEKIASVVTRFAGGTTAFIIAFMIIIAWIISGPLFDYSDTWQLVINTGTTIITFLMVFLIQRSQNKDSIAVHLKLNELIVANETASNRLVAVENISEEDLKILQLFYKKLAKLAQDEMSVEDSHSDVIANLKHEKKTTTIQSGTNKSLKISSDK